MAKFGKKADLDSQKSTKAVECIVSVSDDDVSIDPVTGEPVAYYVEAQRLQDTVNPEDAKAGKADANPYITNKREIYKKADNSSEEIISHQESISVYGMEKIKETAVNEFDTLKSVFDRATGEIKEKTIHNYVVKLNIGFGGPGQSAFFYVPKAVNKTDADKEYSFRNMPQAGRELTQDIINRHNEITKMAQDAENK